MIHIAPFLAILCLLGFPWKAHVNDVFTAGWQYSDIHSPKGTLGGLS